LRFKFEFNEAKSASPFKGGKDSQQHAVPHSAFTVSQKIRAFKRQEPDFFGD
jgi:hypothetical protein